MGTRWPQDRDYRDLEQRAADAGVDLGYHDTRGRWCRSPASSVLRAIETLEIAPHGATGGSPMFLRQGESLPFAGPATLVTEDGSRSTIAGDLPETTPYGYHTIQPQSGEPQLLVVSPGECFLPPALRVWGWAAQLYALRSRASWGVGDLADLARFGRWSASRGAGAVMINPLGAATPAGSMEPSPYYPSSRTFRNPIYLNVDQIEVPADATIHLLREQGQALNNRRLIDRDAAWATKQRALEIIFSRFEQDPDFTRYCERQGSSLDNFTTFCVLAEQYAGTVPAGWPEGFRHPADSAVEGFRRRHHRRIRYHKWLQWQLDRQLAAAGEQCPLVQDLPVGVDPAGADAWIWKGAFAQDFELGAPPDDFNSSGQSWGIAGFHPRGLRLAGYQPFIEMLRAGFSHSAAIRIDHVMGMFRAFWIPSGSPPSQGVYVRYPAHELLDIIALESLRARAYVVGEDLGTVEAQVREEMAARSMLSYRLALFEPEAGDIPRGSMASATTHDLPTLAGIWSGQELAAQKDAGLVPDEDALRGLRDKLAEIAGASIDEPLSSVLPAVYYRLGQTRARVVLATLEDALELVERPNFPGVTEEWPNWSLALPIPLEDFECSSPVNRLIGALESSRGPHH